MKYKLVIFDFDGTLADSMDWFVQMVNSVAIRYSFKQVAMDEVDALRSLSALQLVRHLEIPLWKIPMIANHLRQRMHEDREGIARFAGVDELLRYLHGQGATLALVTSNSLPNVQHVLGEENLALMRYIECDVSMLGKRSRFRKVVRQCGVNPGEAITIGDEIRDIEAANHERIPFGAVAWGYTHIDALMAHAPAEVFLQMEDIIRQIG
jgi:phosphoglycolate phosphatase